MFNKPISYTNYSSTTSHVFPLVSLSSKPSLSTRINANYIDTAYSSKLQENTSDNNTRTRNNEYEHKFTKRNFDMQSFNCERSKLDVNILFIGQVVHY